MTIYRPVSTEVTRLLSTPRMGPYLAACGNKRTAALKLYAWNLDVGDAFFRGIHYLEVALRNTIDEALTQWIAAEQRSNGRPLVPWYLDTNLPFQQVPSTRRFVTQALDRARPAPDPVTGPVPDPLVSQGKVVAEFTFGFWWSMFSAANNRSLWQPCLRHAFPHYGRHRLHSDLDAIRELRNRIGHHEPIHHRDLDAQYQHLVATAERINPKLGWWIDSTSRVSILLDRKP
ncbi:hypothetical protein [Nocardioides zeae]|uniref:hypothetical protein n=1 Tax=Nocardioides zeae TaxID=1457234 RepID=UPI0027D7F1D8|nr:hypothetical protein [Nocardioides zeae]